MSSPVYIRAKFKGSVYCSFTSAVDVGNILFLHHVYKNSSVGTPRSGPIKDLGISVREHWLWLGPTSVLAKSGVTGWPRLGRATHTRGGGGGVISQGIIVQLGWRAVLTCTEAIRGAGLSMGRSEDGLRSP